MSAHGRTQTHTLTQVKTVYPPVSLRSLGGYRPNHRRGLFVLSTGAQLNYLKRLKSNLLYNVLK